MLAIGAIYIVRLFVLQIIQNDYYEAEALNEHMAKFSIPATRGLIYAKDGASSNVPLALNEPAYTAYADPRYVDDVEGTTTFLRKIAGGNLVDGFEESLSDKDRQYAVMAKMLNNDQAKLVKEENLPGIGLQKQERRVYPEGQMGAQLLGYVNSEGVGQYGVEQQLNDMLSGADGMLKTVTDVNGIPISISDEDIQTPAQNGQDLLLNIDRNVQAYVEQALKDGLEKANAKTGSAIVMDPQTGAVLAMADCPTYDPAKYYEVSDYDLFVNHVVSDPYEAGSVIKSLTMATGLNEGVVSPNSTYQNTGSVQVDDANIKNVLQSVSGTRSMTEVLEYSLNTGVVHVLQQLGGGEINRTARDKLYGYFSDRFMFGKLTGIEQAWESPGRIIAPDQAEGNNVRYANMTFGQGMDTTMVQVAAAFSSAINGGTYYKPQVVDAYLKDGEISQDINPEIIKAGVITADTSNKLKQMLVEARSKSFKNIDKSGYTVGGKTGTSQVIDPETGKYTDDNAIGSYVGFGGNDAPQYVIMVRVKDAKISSSETAGAVTAPIFADISNWMLDYLKIQPKS
jgi:cell division protein FtsI/penicillin-binding protein 2